MRPLDDDTRRALLVDRQLVGAPGRGRRTTADVADAVGPLHSTDPSSAFLQIAARSDAGPDAITTALYDDRSLLRHTTLRRTVHLLTPPLALAAHGAYNHRLVPKLRDQLVAWLAATDDVTGGEDGARRWLSEVERRVVAAVAALDRPTGSDLAEAVPDLKVEVEPAPGTSYGRPIRITSKVIELLIAEGRLARDRPRSGDLTSSAWTYAPVTDWIPDGLPVPDPDGAAAALVDLLAHKLRAMPGCSEVDLAWWAGLPKGAIRSALRSLDAVPVLRDDGATGWVLPDDDLVVDPPGDDAVALLPGLDATPMGVKERDWFLGPHRPALFDTNGNIGPTVWWRGRVVGGWTQRADGTVVTELLEPVPRRASGSVDDEAARLRSWLGPVRVRWRYPTPLQRSLDSV